MKSKPIVVVFVAVVIAIGFLWFGGLWPNSQPAPVENSSSVLSGTKWVWKETHMGDGEVIKPNSPGAFTLSFGSDGMVSGTTDCNGFSGSYEAESSGVLSFGPFASTLMYCEGSQEGRFIQMVTESNQYIFTEDGELVLLIKFDSGSVIFTRN